jgi:digeranylgeranylglycerophospholipid reductase
VTRIRFAGPSTGAVFEYARAPLCIIDVRGTYRLLAERAEAAGARILVGRRVVGLLPDGGCMLDGGEPARARIAIDASGYRAALSRLAGLHAGFSRFGVGAEVELVAPRVRQDEAVLVVGSRYAPAGYAWVFPWGEGRVRLGTGVHHADVRADPRRLLERLVAEAEGIGIDLTGSEVVEEHFGLIPAERMPRRLAGDRILAVGDAACQATLVVGEGIRLSLEAGELAGRTAAAALARGRTDRRALSSYERRFRRSHGASLALGRAVNRRIARYDDGAWDEKIRLLARAPASLIPPLLQSQVPLGAVPWLARTPALWPAVTRALVDLAA